MLNGENLLFRENGDILGIENYNNGTLEGQFIRYFTDGRIKEAGEYKNGLEHGYWYFGSLSGENCFCLFDNGVGVEGVRKWGRDDKDYWWWRIEYKNGGKEITFVEYNEDPYYILQITNVLDGRLHGKHIVYNGFPEIESIEIFDKGQLIEKY